MRKAPRTSPSRAKRCLIYGAGTAGQMVLLELRKSARRVYEVKGFLDDDRKKRGKLVDGVPVLGGQDVLAGIAEDDEVDIVIIAMPTAGGEAVRRIAKQCEGLRIEARVYPGVIDIISGRYRVSPVRSIQLDDLVRRPVGKLDFESIRAYVQGKRVLVTGAGGSIGTALCKEIVRLRPALLILMDNSENNLFELSEYELRSSEEGVPFEPFLADVRDRKLMREAFRRYSPHVVFHAAACKHVGMMEQFPLEGVKTNVFGTRNVAEAARLTATESFIYVSTDKAVHPTSFMGATKRIGEMVVRHALGGGRTRHGIVRFGNVVGTRGSVLPLFSEQISRGGPVLVTHPEMVRYFMTKEEAASLILQAGAYCRRGEVFLLEMGKPMKILELAETMIRMAGLEPYSDIPIRFIGQRPGEKLKEELLYEIERPRPTSAERITYFDSPPLTPVRMAKLLAGLETLVKEQRKEVDLVRLLRDHLPSFKHATH